MTEATKVAGQYSAEQTEKLVEAYKAGETIEALATQFGKSVRSIVAKLAREKVYKAKEKEASTRGATKAELVAAIAAKTGLDASVLETFGKADKAALQALAAVLK
jgi:putative methionine-R-sulfoxide reductase with GAF domain